MRTIHIIPVGPGPLGLALKEDGTVYFCELDDDGKWLADLTRIGSSSAALCEALRDAFGEMGERIRGRRLSLAPQATRAAVRCKDCKYRNAELRSCNLLSGDCTPIPFEERQRIRLAYTSGYEPATLQVDDDFGCVHGEPRE